MRSRDGEEKAAEGIELESRFDTRRIAVKFRMNPNPLFKRGQIFRAVLEVPKTAPARMSIDELGTALMAAKGVAEPTRDQRRLMYRAIASSLRDYGGGISGSDGGAAQAVATQRA